MKVRLYITLIYVHATPESLLAKRIRSRDRRCTFLASASPPQRLRRFIDTAPTSLSSSRCNSGVQRLEYIPHPMIAGCVNSSSKTMNEFDEFRGRLSASPLLLPVTCPPFRAFEYRHWPVPSVEIFRRKKWVLSRSPASKGAESALVVYFCRI